jgi:shikimate kinase
MAPGQSIESLYQERYPLYMQYADITVSSGNLTLSRLLERIACALADLDK